MTTRTRNAGAGLLALFMFGALTPPHIVLHWALDLALFCTVVVAALLVLHAGRRLIDRHFDRRIGADRDVGSLLTGTTPFLPSTEAGDCLADRDSAGIGRPSHRTGRDSPARDFVPRAAEATETLQRRHRRRPHDGGPS
ncbi:MAG TPA: hypothetical protein VNF71_02625 [Acidimicrobiales bacterium]|nr:hypothetical protein [Acidimicrobiales bacterium]